jgi:phage terminase small subunit
MPVLSSPRRETFANLVARGKTQLEAYVLAGYTESMSNPATLANTPEVAERIKEIQRVIAAKAQVTGERVLAELARLGFSDVTEAVQVKNGKVVIKDTDELPADLRAAISEISQSRDGLKVKFHDKVAALEKLGKHLGMFKDTLDVNLNVSLLDLVNGSYKLEQGQVVEADVTSAIEPPDKPPE